LLKHPGTWENSTPTERECHLALCDIAKALVTEQYIGDHIGRQVLQHHLVDIHAQLAKHLQILSEKGYHYRDINDGNIRALRGSRNRLMIIDYGNARKTLGRRGSPDTSDAEATIDRATDDTRSMTQKIVPVCTQNVEDGVRRWHGQVEYLSRAIKRLSRPRDCLESRLRILSEGLPELRASLLQAAVQSRRHIDDLESAAYRAAYLHLWQVSEMCLWSAIPGFDVLFSRLILTLPDPFLH
jgi:serine/threonine protein kinase